MQEIRMSPSNLTPTSRVTSGCHPASLSGVLVFQCGTAAMECVRQYISEVLDFMADMHTLTKLKVRGARPPPRDHSPGTVGEILKQMREAAVHWVEAEP